MPGSGSVPDSATCQDLASLLARGEPLGGHLLEKLAHAAGTENNPIVTALEMEMDYLFASKCVRHYKGNAR